jgi:UDP-N-acetylglucosamine 2-epimerase (non-hydrolysing)/GDP/UDP-N,N'-diacetylbacillosamine 2-epimerase (hydrolysing)
VHIHGGETSQGALDESIRHSITKMASLHFPATEIYRNRIIQMGENPEFVFNYGAPGLDNIYKKKLMDRHELQKHLDFDLSGKVAIVTYHPVTLENNTAGRQIGYILKAIKQSGIKAIFTQANADVYGRIINEKISEFCAVNSDIAGYYDTLGQIPYLSCLRNLDLMVGNSSSGLIEAPSFRMPVVNIGDRQKGRIKAKNVIDVGYSLHEILKGIETACSVEFRKKIKNMKNPYCRFRDGNVSYRIKEKIRSVRLNNSLLKKKFNDMDL